MNKDQLADRDIDLLIRALDDDGGGTLSIDELADFVDRGYATFNSGPDDGPKRIDEFVAKKIQSRLKLAIRGSTAKKVFGKFDKDGGGSLDAKEFRRMIRAGLKIGKVRGVRGSRGVGATASSRCRHYLTALFHHAHHHRLPLPLRCPSSYTIPNQIDITDEDIEALIVALDDDGGGTLSIDELADFVERGSATFHAGPEEKKPEEPEKKPEPIKAKKLRKVISVN